MMMIRPLLQAFAGRVAAASAARLALLPDVPTAVESGVPGYEVTACASA